MRRISPRRPHRAAPCLALAGLLSAGGARAEEPAGTPAPAPAPGTTAAPPPAVAAQSGSDPAVRLSVRRSSAMVHTGMVFTGLGIFGIVTGIFVMVQAPRDPLREEELRLTGALVLGGGVVFAGIGVPLWTYGATPVPVRKGAASVRPVLWLTPGGAALGGTF